MFPDSVYQLYLATFFELIAFCAIKDCNLLTYLLLTITISNISIEAVRGKTFPINVLLEVQLRNFLEVISHPVCSL